MAGNVFQGRVTATLDGDTQELPSRWSTTGQTFTLEMIDQDDSRVWCVFDRAQNGVLLGTATFKESPQDAGDVIGSCQLAIAP